MIIIDTALAKREREEFGTSYKEASHQLSVKEQSDSIPTIFEHALEKQIGIVIAGTAGERVQSAAYLFAQACALSGLQCTQKNDNPVTQGSGFSLSELCISPEEIFYTGIERPEAVIVVSHDGLKELHSKALFQTLSSDSLLIMDNSLPVPETAATVLRRPMRDEVGGNLAATAALVLYLKQASLFPVEAYRKSIERYYGAEKAKPYLTAIDRGYEL
jgi:Pyruvate/2-oxoacid:ferredoxin oxidoreductase gamma subunit